MRSEKNALFQVVRAAAPDPGWSRQILRWDDEDGNKAAQVVRPVFAAMLDDPQMKYVAVLLVPGWDANPLHLLLIDVVRERRAPTLLVVWEDRKSDASHPALHGLNGIGCVSVSSRVKAIDEPTVSQAITTYAQQWYAATIWRAGEKLAAKWSCFELQQLQQRQQRQRFRPHGHHCRRTTRSVREPHWNSIEVDGGGEDPDILFAHSASLEAALSAQTKAKQEGRQVPLQEKIDWLWIGLVVAAKPDNTYLLRRYAEAYERLEAGTTASAAQLVAEPVNSELN